MAATCDLVGVGMWWDDEVARDELISALHEAVRARDNLLAIVAHDLRNYLSTILASAELLAEAAPHVSERPLGALRRSASQMARIIGCGQVSSTRSSASGTGRRPLTRMAKQARCSTISASATSPTTWPAACRSVR